MEKRPAVALASGGNDLALENLGCRCAGVLLLAPGGGIEDADERALALLGCKDLGELAKRWEEIAPVLQSRPEEARLMSVQVAGNPWAFERRSLGTGGRSIILIHDPQAWADITADLDLAAYFRALSQASPAVAHDLRAPINAMVFNIEILKETLNGERFAEPTARARQQRYVGVLKEELSRLHTNLEHFLSHTSSRGDRAESIDLRAALGELVALLIPQARKLQIQVISELPEQPVPITGNPYQLRQALLETGLAALAGVERAGALTLRLASDRNRAHLSLRGPRCAEAPEPDFSLAPGAAPAGRVRLHHARAVFAGHGGTVEVVDSGVDRSFEVEFPVSGKE